MGNCSRETYRIHVANLAASRDWYQSTITAAGTGHFTNSFHSYFRGSSSFSQPVFPSPNTGKIGVGGEWGVVNALCLPSSLLPEGNSALAMLTAIQFAAGSSRINLTLLLLHSWKIQQGPCPAVSSSNSSESQGSWPQTQTIRLASALILSSETSVQCNSQKSNSLPIIIKILFYFLTFSYCALQIPYDFACSEILDIEDQCEIFLYAGVTQQVSVCQGRVWLMFDQEEL